MKATGLRAKLAIGFGILLAMLIMTGSVGYYSTAEGHRSRWEREGISGEKGGSDRCRVGSKKAISVRILVCV
jgi:hypothetical protein